MSDEGLKFRINLRGDAAEKERSLIRRPITDDGLVGYDEFGQLMVTKIDGDRRTSWHVADVRDATCVMCERGWEPTGPSMADQAEWQVSRTLVHETCLVRFAALRQRESYWSTLVEARVRFGGLRPVPNRYWPPSDPWARQPWYEAELLDHPAKFVLGMRKHVHHVEVVAQGGVDLGFHAQAGVAFHGEDVTKHFTGKSILLHAHTTPKMREYVGTLVELAGYAREIG